jgi:hypothetical protein
MRKKRFVYGAGWAAALLCTGAPALGTPLPREGVFVYSSLCREKESGDAAGFRIVLFHSSDRDQLSLEWSEGPLYGPTLAGNVKLDPLTSKLTFTIPQASAPTGDPPLDNYEAEITSESVLLKLVGAADRRGHAIPRVRGFAQIRPC